MASITEIENGIKAGVFEILEEKTEHCLVVL